MIVLIDSGSTHNFLSKKVARLLVPTKSFVVNVASGERLLYQGHFEKVQMNLQGITFSLTLYNSLRLVGLDMVLGIQWLEMLGIQWLEMLGSMVYNWKQLTRTFTRVIKHEDCKELTKPFKRHH